MKESSLLRQRFNIRQISTTKIIHCKQKTRRLNEENINVENITRINIKCVSYVGKWNVAASFHLGQEICLEICPAYAMEGNFLSITRKNEKKEVQQKNRNMKRSQKLQNFGIPFLDHSLTTGGYFLFLSTYPCFILYQEKYQRL